MKKLTIITFVLILSVSAFAKTYIVEYTTTENDPSLRSFAYCTASFGPCEITSYTPTRLVYHFDHFKTLDEAMQNAADRQLENVRVFEADEINVQTSDETVTVPQPPKYESQRTYKVNCRTYKKSDDSPLFIHVTSGEWAPIKGSIVKAK